MVIYDAMKISDSRIGKRDTSLLFRSVLNKSSLELILQRNITLTDIQLEKINQAVNRIESGEPLQYVVGSTEFMSLTFYVNPSVLIPRSDTECLIEYIIEKAGNEPEILDIGTGSGCIAVSLAYYIKKAAVSAIDISKKALETAAINANANNVSINFFQHDIMKELTGSFDIIVSNPPYIETDIIPTLDKNVRDFEPVSALDGGMDGLDFYRRITGIAPSLLNKNGMLCFEVGYTQSDAVKKMMSDKFCNIEIIKDLCGVNRAVCGTLVSNS